MKTGLLQLGALSLVYLVATADILKPGYMQFYNPIEALPWQSEAASLFSTTCKRSQSIDVSQAEWLLQFIQVGKPTIHEAELTLGKPDCQGEKDGYTVLSWDSKRIRKLALPDVTLRLSFDKETGNIVKYEVLR